MNPFAYIHSEKDILKLVTTLIANTKGDQKGGDPFWEKSETLLYTALIAYLHYESPAHERNFSTLAEMIGAMEVREDDEEFKNVIDLMFGALAKPKPPNPIWRRWSDNCITQPQLRLMYNSMSRFFVTQNHKIIKEANHYGNKNGKNQRH